MKYLIVLLKMAMKSVVTFCDVLGNKYLTPKIFLFLFTPLIILADALDYVQLHDNQKVTLFALVILETSLFHWFIKNYEKKAYK